MNDRLLYGAIALAAVVSSCQAERPVAKVPPIEIQLVPKAAVASAHKLPAGAKLASFPPRSDDAMGGKEFLESLSGMTAPQREEAIYQEVLAGNVPDHLRAMLPVQLRAVARDGSIVTGTAWVLPDYLAIGSDDDYVRMPINEFTATRLAEELGLALPTQKLVNAIYAQATVRLRPKPLPAGPEMTTTEYFQWHNDIIEDQLRQKAVDGAEQGHLIAGHKKDVVMTNRLMHRQDRIAIYGWHQLDAKPIQPLSTVHDAGYADYSHGIRFVDPVLRVNGRDVQITQVLGDARLAELLSSEGRMAKYDDLMHPTRVAFAGGNQ
jgi:hypothetical protein